MKSRLPSFSPRRALLRAAFALLAATATGGLPVSHAATLVPPGDTNYSRGRAVAISGGTAVVASNVNASVLNSSVYVYQGVGTATGSVSQSAQLTSADGQAGQAGDNFGISLSLAGGLGLVGAPAFSNSGYTSKVYVYNNLSTASGTVTESAQLRPSDLTGYTNFAYTVSLSGTSGLVGASNAGSNAGGGASGEAYVYRNLNTATGTITENVRLLPSDAATIGVTPRFGFNVSLSGNMGLVGAYNATINGNATQGQAYVFRNLDTASGSITENVKLLASDGAATNMFGYNVSLSGSTGVAGAYRATVGSNAYQGAAYVFRNLDTATGTITQNVKLLASDGAANSAFGFSVAESGNVALVGAPALGTNGNINTTSTAQGAAYVFRNLDTASGTVTQNVKLVASDGAANDHFGYAMSVDGDRFVIGAPQNQTSQAGKSYTGTFSSFTTLDAGNSAGLISGISFTTQDDWIIGQNTSANQVTLSAGDTANVTATGKAVYIGQNAGSNNNRLIIAGTVNANTFTVGATGNTGNTLQLGNGGTTGSLPVAATINNSGVLAFNRSNAVVQGTDFSGAALTGTGGVTQLGTGTTTLNAANTYTGPTTVNAGVLALTSTGTLANTASVTINAGGMLTLGAANRINAAASLTLNAASGPGAGATVAFNTGGFSQTLGAVTLSSTSVVDLGSGTSLLRLGNSVPNAWTGTLAIWNYTGTAVTGNGTDELFFGANTAGLTPAQLADIKFYSDSGTTLLANAGYANLTGGEVVPGGLFPATGGAVPEPSTWAMLGLGVGLLGVTLRRRAVAGR